MADFLAGMRGVDVANPLVLGLLVFAGLCFAVLLWRGPRLLAAVIVLIALAGGSALALRPASVSASGSVLRIEGSIRPSTVEAVRRTLQAGAPTILELRSGVGIDSIAAARQVAELVRAHRVVTTLIGPCSSACAILFLAGTERELPSDPAARAAHVLFGPGIDWAPELRRIDAPAAFAAEVERRVSQGRGFAPAELVEANVVTRIRPGGLSFVCVDASNARPVTGIATALPGSRAWHSRTLSPYGGHCGSFVRLGGEAGRLDVRLDLAGGESRVCRDVVLRGIGDVLSVSGDSATLRIQRRGFWLQTAPDEVREQTVRCG